MHYRGAMSRSLLCCIHTYFHFGHEAKPTHVTFIFSPFQYRLDCPHLYMTKVGKKAGVIRTDIINSENKDNMDLPENLWIHHRRNPV